MKTKTILALISAAAIAVNPMSAVCSAAEYYPTYEVRESSTSDTGFAILGYNEKNGELTITSCFDYNPDFKVNPKVGGYIAVFYLNGTLQIPSHIDDKPVIGIKSLSGYEKISEVIIPDSVANISRTAYSGCNLIIKTSEDEFRLTTMYC